MNASLSELLENQRSGLLWVTRDGVVRYANGEAVQRTGLAAGRKLYDPDLLRAVVQSVAGRVPRTVAAVGSASQSANTLDCRILPGLAQDDAFVLIAPDPTQDHGSGFDNLMQAIRADLQEPLREAQTMLRQAVTMPAEPAAAEALLDRVGAVLSVADRLVELAGLWTSGALLGSDRIELLPLLQRVWAEVEPLAIDRSVKVRFRAQADGVAMSAVYGSERWIHRVLLECLDAAVRGTQRGATLEIEHRQIGPRALIVFRDCGLFAQPDPRAVAMNSPKGAAAGAPKRGAMSAREQIGFKLCQHIVALHGGHLREEMDDGVRDFLIDLPTGAPHHEEPQLDVAQVQRYASDLAALMTRARRKPAAQPAAPGPSTPKETA